MGIKKHCQVLSCRRTGEGDAISTPGKHGAQSSPVEVFGKHSAISRYHVDSRTSLFQSPGQIVAGDGGSGQQHIQAVQLFATTYKLSKRLKRPFSFEFSGQDIHVDLRLTKFFASGLANSTNLQFI